MDTYADDVILIYHQVLSRERLRFPMCFWQGREGRAHAAILARYALEKDSLDPCESTKATFTSRRLKTALDVCGGTYALIDAAYPGRYHPWELVQTPVGYWTDEGWEERASVATRWMIEERLGWKPEEIPGKLEYRIFHANCLGGMINIAFNESLFAAVDNAYPGVFMPWEFRKLKLEWTPELAAEAVRWLILEKLQLSPEEAIGAITHEMMLRHNLISAYRAVGSSLRRLLVNAFPDLESRYWAAKDQALGPAGAARLRGLVVWTCSVSECSKPQCSVLCHIGVHTGHFHF